MPKVLKSDFLCMLHAYQQTVERGSLLPLKELWCPILMGCPFMKRFAINVSLPLCVHGQINPYHLIIYLKTSLQIESPSSDSSWWLGKKYIYLCSLWKTESSWKSLILIASGKRGGFFREFLYPPHANIIHKHTY